MTPVCSRCSTLEGAQAGLSWSTILHKREGYRRAFAGFDPAKVARFSDAKVERLLQDPSIVRNRLKVDVHRRRTLARRSPCATSSGRSTPTCGRSSAARRS